MNSTIKEILEINSTVKEINTNPFLYGMYSPDVIPFVKDSARILKYYYDNEKAAINSFDKILDKFKILLEEFNNEETKKSFEREYKKCSKALPLLIARKWIERIARKNELIIETKKQKIQSKEVAYLTKRITTKIGNKNFAVISRNYFLSDGFKKSYKKATGRTINEHKIGHIINFFEKHNFFKVARKYKKDKKWQPLSFSMASGNPYFLEKKVEE